MIFYFTGTGNSIFIAEEIRKFLKEEKLKDISEVILKKEDLSIYKNEEYIGIIFPVYACNPPNIVIEFLKMLPNFSKNTYVFAIAHFANEGKGTYLTLKKALNSRGIDINMYLQIVMPNNFMLFGNGKTQEENTKILQEAKSVISSFGPSIERKENIINYRDSISNKFASKALKPMSDIIIKSLYKKFYAKDNCTSCEFCVKICPTNAISMKNSKPKWNKNCVACFGCINRCPEIAIENGKKSIGKFRYINPILIDKDK